MIDINFDFQAEAGVDRNGKQRDSDRYSPTLQEYHRKLWSKKLPNGHMFNLTNIGQNRLHHISDLGEFFLSSDRAVATFFKWENMEHIISQVSKEKLDTFVHLSDKIGGIVIWPSKQIKHMPTINSARGFSKGKEIADRLDLTIECIKRYYCHEENNPLYDTLSRYKDFFDLFVDFKGYIDFFLLQDAVSNDYSTVNIAIPFDNFSTFPVPHNVDEYIQYMETTSKFVNKRNMRISSM